MQRRQSVCKKWFAAVRANRQRRNNRSCRCECPAMIRLLRTSDNGWYITEHRANHNHALTQTCGEKVNWPSHKHIDVYTKDLVKQLRQNNVNVTKAYSIISSFFGDVDKVPFTKRTPRNLCGKINKEQAEDVRKTIDIFADIAAKDQEFVFRVQNNSKVFFGDVDKVPFTKRTPRICVGSLNQLAELWCAHIRLGLER